MLKDFLLGVLFILIAQLPVAILISLFPKFCMILYIVAILVTIILYAVVWIGDDKKDE